MFRHIALLGTGGAVYVSGPNLNGQLGLGPEVAEHRGLTKVENIPRFSSVANSCSATYAVSEEDGSIWWCGNKNLQIDSPSLTNSYLFAKMPDTANFISVSCGRNFLIALDTRGKVWGLGSNTFGQLGLSAPPCAQGRLIENPHLFDIKSMATGESSSLTLDINGIVRVFGSNTSGQLGFPTLEKGGSNKILVPTPIDLQSPAIKIATGGNHSLVLDCDLAVWGFGDNRRGELGLGDCMFSQMTKIPIPSDSVDIACGSHSSYITDTNENVWVMGCDDDGQLALADESTDTSRQFLRFKAMNDPSMSRICALQINQRLYQKKLYPVGDSLLVVDREGFLYGCGSNLFGKLLQSQQQYLLELVPLYHENVFCTHQQSSRIKSAGSFIDVPAQ